MSPQNTPALAAGQPATPDGGDAQKGALTAPPRNDDAPTWASEDHDR